MFEIIQLLEFGCGCSKGRTPQTPGASIAVKRTTIYQVMQSGNVLSEFTTLSDARAAAVAAGGGSRVKVTSRVQ